MLLHLSSIKELQTKEENDHKITVDASLVAEEKHCPNCHGTTLYKHGSKYQLYMDIPIDEKLVEINLDRKRYQCKDCQKTFFQQCPDMSSTHRATTRLVKFIEGLAIDMPATTVAKFVGMTEGTVRNIRNVYISNLESKFTFKTPTILGIDETYLNNATRLVLFDIQRKKVIDLLETPSKQIIANALYSFKNKEKIKAVSICMEEIYIDAVRGVLPNAIIIIDKSHLLRMANKYTKAAYSDITKNTNNAFDNDFFLTPVHAKEITNKHLDLLSLWKQNNPELYALFYANQNFCSIWNGGFTSKEAETAYLSWVKSLPIDIKKYYIPLEKQILKWRSEVFNYFNYSDINSYTEQVYNKIKSINKEGRGYSFDILRAKIIFQGDFITPQPPK